MSDPANTNSIPISDTPTSAPTTPTVDNLTIGQSSNLPLSPPPLPSLNLPPLQASTPPLSSPTTPPQAPPPFPSTSGSSAIDPPLNILPPTDPTSTPPQPATTPTQTPTGTDSDTPPTSESNPPPPSEPTPTPTSDSPTPPPTTPSDDNEASEQSDNSSLTPSDTTDSKPTAPAVALAEAEQTNSADSSIPDNLPNPDLPTPADTSPESPNLTGPTPDSIPTPTATDISPEPEAPSKPADPTTPDPNLPVDLPVSPDHTNVSTDQASPSDFQPTPPPEASAEEGSTNPTPTSDSPADPPLTPSVDNGTIDPSNHSSPSSVDNTVTDPSPTSDSPTDPPLTHFVDNGAIEPSNHSLPSSDNQTMGQLNNQAPDPANPPTQSDELTSLAKRFSINTSKPHFPVNTLRLYYLLMVDAFTSGNQEALDQANSVIPKISILLNTREQLAARSQPDPAAELKACQPHIKAITDIISTPVIDTLLNHLFTYIYPLQDQLLVSLDHMLQQPTLTDADLLATLKIRAMDSVAYSTILGEIINQHIDPALSGTTPTSDSPTSSNTPPSANNETMEQSDNDATTQPTNPSSPTTYYLLPTTPIHYQVNLTSQINDVVDAVVYAKQDLEAGTATLIDIVRKIHSDPVEVEKLITGILTSLISKSASLPLPDPAQSTITDFNQNLANVLKSSK